MSSGVYLGVRYEVWNRPDAWFWLVVDSRRDAGAIGAATREIDAIREACSSIEEMMSKHMVRQTPVYL